MTAPNPDPPTPIVGIDLGTTNSLVAIATPTGPRILLDDDGRPLVPSVVRYEAGLPTAVGFDAKADAPRFPRSTLASVKRLMGRSRADAATDLPFLNYEVVEGERGQCRIRLSDIEPSRDITPQEVSAEVLKRLKSIAESRLGVPVRRAVVTVPAFFDHAQREATKDAGRLAGLDVVRIVPEPTAAALAYGLGLRALSTDPNAKRAARTIAVFDLGGGTFDVSILRVVPPDAAAGMTREIFQVLATSGDTRLGGDDVDHLLVQRCTDEILAARGQPIELPPRARALLLAAAERAKIELSTQDSTTLRVRIDDSMIYERDLTRTELETLIAPWVDRAMACCRRALDDAAQSGPIEIEAVVMVGGSTRIPLVRRRVAEFFALEPYTAIDPDQVVALGAAVQASILAGDDRSSLLLDVIPLSLGLETAGGAVAKLVIRNSTVPTRATEMFSTQVDNQTSIKLHIVQGEREMVDDCRSLGVFHLRGLPAMPAGIPQVEVEFLVDANGVLQVSAHERRSGRRAQLQVVPTHGLSRNEVAQMEAASLTHAVEDMARHRVADLIVNSKLDLKWIGERLAQLTAAPNTKVDAAYAKELTDRIDHLRSLVALAESDWRAVDANEFYWAKDSLDRASVRLQEISIAESLKS